MEVLQDTSGTSYSDQLAMTIFICHCELDCRPGALIELTTDELDCYEPGNSIRTRRLKTGNLRPNFVQFTAETYPFIQKLHERFEEEFGSKPELVFPNSCDQKITNLAYLVKRLVQKHLQITSTDFTATAVRKALETLQEKTKFAKGRLRPIYEDNSGHEKDTRKEHYVAGPTDVEIAALFEKQREMMASEPTGTVLETVLDAPQDDLQDETPKEDGENEQDKEKDEEDSEALPLIQCSSKTDQELEPQNASGDAPYSPDPCSDAEKSDQIDDLDNEPTNKKTKVKDRYYYVDPVSGQEVQCRPKAKNTRGSLESRWEEFDAKVRKAVINPERIRQHVEHILFAVSGRRKILPKQNLRDIAAGMGLRIHEEPLFVDRAYAMMKNFAQQLDLN